MGWIGLSGGAGFGKLGSVEDGFEIELGCAGCEEAFGDLGWPFGIASAAPFSVWVFPVDMAMDGFPGLAAFGEERE